MEDTELQELQKDTFIIVLFLVAALGTAFFSVRLINYTPYHESTNLWWLPSALVFLTCFASYRLYQYGRFRPATYLFIGGLTLTVVSFMTWSIADFSRGAAYLLLLVVAMAGLLINPHAALWAAGAAIGTTLTAVIFWGGFSWSIIQPLLLPLAMTGGMAIISWVSSDHLTTAVSWALYSQERTRQRTQELLESQQELQKAYVLLESANVRLKQAEAAAVHANELKTRFITNLSHELRTPLNAIINFSYILARNHHGAVTPEQRDYLTRIHYSGELLLEIVNDLLDLAKIEAGQMELFREPVELRPLCADLIKAVSGLLTDKPVELLLDITPNLPSVNGDETRIRQVLLNLLGNAAKYTDKGSIMLRLSPPENGFIRISVVDTGIGIREKDLEKIFEEFHQTEEAFALRKVGTGLGLPISRKFVELHGGRLWVESQFGQGSAFHFTLPVDTDSLAALEEMDNFIMRINQ